MAQLLRGDMSHDPCRHPVVVLRGPRDLPERDAGRRMEDLMLEVSVLACLVAIVCGVVIGSKVVATVSRELDEAERAWHEDHHW